MVNSLKLFRRVCITRWRSRVRLSVRGSRSCSPSQTMHVCSGAQTLPQRSARRKLCLRIRVANSTMQSFRRTVGRSAHFSATVTLFCGTLMVLRGCLTAKTKAKSITSECLHLRSHFSTSDRTYLQPVALLSPTCTLSNNSPVTVNHMLCIGCLIRPEASNRWHS